MSGAAPPPLPVTVLRGHSSGVQAVCYLTDNILLSGSQDGLVKIWSLERRRACGKFQATSRRDTGVQRLDRLGRDRVVSQGRDTLINVWDAERLACSGGGGGGGQEKTLTAEPLQQLPTGAFHFCQFALTRWRDEAMPAGQESSSSGGSGSSSSSSSSSNAIHASSGSRLREDDDSGDQDQRRGRTETHEELPGTENDGASAAEAAAGAAAVEPKPATPPEADEGEEPNCTPEGSAFQENVMLAPCGEQHSISVWDLREGRPAFMFAPKDAARKGMVMCVRLLGESSSCPSPFAVTGHDSGHLCVYDLRATSAEPLLESRLHTAPMVCVDVGSSCKQGVSGSADESIHIFRISIRKASCRVVKTFSLEHPGTSCLEIRRDQKLFVSGGWDHRVRAFSWKSPRPLAVLRSHEKNVHAVAYSPRLGGLVSGSGDSRVAVWELFPDKKGGGDLGGAHGGVS